MSDAAALTIGQVTHLLNAEFPDLTMSKVRFLETRGMVHPARSSSGYRLFRSGDIKRLRFILQKQRDHFLPLKVIKSQLAQWERGEEPDFGEPTAAEASPSPEPYEQILEFHELARRLAISRYEIRQLISHGLLVPREEDGALKFTTLDLAIAHQCGVLLEQGLEPRHLRTVRNAVARHVELLVGLTVAMRRNRSPDARRQAAETLNSGVEAMRRLCDLLFLAEVKTILDED